MFTTEQKSKIVEAIKSAEKNTSGEIKVHIEKTCDIDVLDRAAQVFESLELHKTKLRNGVLIYLAIESKTFAILGDSGINAVVAKGFWDSTKDIMLAHFKKGEFTEGLIQGICSAGKQLKQYFAYQSDDVNEISDDISFN